MTDERADVVDESPVVLVDLAALLVDPSMSGDVAAGYTAALTVGV